MIRYMASKVHVDGSLKDILAGASLRKPWDMMEPLRISQVSGFYFFFFYHSWFLPHSSMFQIPLSKGSSLDTISLINSHLQEAMETKPLISSPF